MAAVLALFGLLHSLSLSAGDDESDSARAKLEALRKARAKNAKAEKDHAKKAAHEPGDKSSKYPWASPDDVSYIDEMLQKEWTDLKFPVAEPCTDGEFVRRVTLDLIGRIPTYDETLAYLNDKSKDRKDNLVNRLLASEEFGRHFATNWANLLITDGRANGANQDINPNALRGWLEKEFNQNTGWDKWFMR